MSYLIPVSMAWSDQEYCFSAWVEWKSIPSSLPSFRDIPPGAIFTLGWVERELLKIKCLDQENDPGRSWYPVLSIQDFEPSASIKRSHLSHILRMFPFCFVWLQMEHYWQECLRLPQRIQEWDAYKEMRDAIKHYLDVFPTLHKLNSKVCTGSFFSHGFCLLVF